MMLSNFERETVISFNESPELASIYTHNKAWQRHLERVIGLKGEDMGFGAKEYFIDKHRIPKPRAPRKITMSDKKRKEVGKRLPAARRNHAESSETM